MINRKYLLDACALLIFTLSSCSFVFFSHQQQEQQSLYKKYNQLENLAPKVLNELLDINFVTTQHYDIYSQLQLQLERIKRELPESSPTRDLITEYISLSSRYMELASMLKTSRRLIAFANTDALKDDERELVLKLNTLLNQYSLARNNVDLTRILGHLASAKLVFAKSQNEQFSWSHYLQHYLFVLDNLELATSQKEKLQAIDVSQTLIAQREGLSEQQRRVQSAILVSVFAVICSFVLVFIAILRRQRSLLIDKSEQYREAAEVKSRFLANMSHEIRTPMTGIIGLAELCLTTKLNDTQHDYLKKLHFSATSLLVIINDILDFSKIESGKLAIENIDFDHTKLFDNLTVLVGKTAQDKSIELIYDLDKNIPNTLNGDAVRTSQILLNLVNNGIKFTEQGHVTVKSKLLESKENQVWVEYQVTDTGIGLSAQQQARLFNRFEQADDSTTRKYGGTGLGLSIVKLLCELLGGRVSVSSEAGKGSCFTVVLPYREAINAADPTMDLASLKDKEILIIEDNTITQTVMQSMAQELGLKVTLAATVEQAVSFCAGQHYDFALIDWHLPEQSGLVFIEQTQGQKTQPERLIVCSAFDLPYIQQRVGADVAFEYIAKPLTRWSLYQLLTKNQEQIELDTKVVEPSSNILFTDKKVLLVEDNKVNQTIALAMIRNFGLTPLLAENGQEAIDMVLEQDFDIVLMDIQMPVLDGVSATKEIRKRFSSMQLPIIALTANVTEEEVAFYLQNGMNSHLGKPYDKGAMNQLLKDYLLPCSKAR